jgi:hypothetical protein
MPRPFNAAAICQSDFAPAAWALRIAGMTAAARASALALRRPCATVPASDNLGLPRALGVEPEARAALLAS